MHRPTLPFLLELVVEELPASFVDAALASLPGLWEEACASLRLAHSPVRVFGTPRRLALSVDALACMQEDLHEEVVGPPEAIAFRNGEPTQAAHAFAAKLGLPVDTLTVRACSGAKGAGRYLVGQRRELGRPAAELLGPALTTLCSNIPFRIAMRWGEGSTTFGRPVQGLVALFGDQVIDFTFAGVPSGRTTCGHRFLAPERVEILSPTTYVEQMRAAHVVVDREERKAMLVQQLDEAATRVGGAWERDEALLDENTSLVEKPHTLVGSFDTAFLTLPAEVLRAVARGHQKYFCLTGPDGTLLPHYLVVANTANDIPAITQGNDRVMRARLADARFFFEEDQKRSLEERLPQLEGVTFHHRLGSVRRKVERIETLAHVLATELALPAEACGQLARAARLCKTDLVSLTVGEFPELQGVVGGSLATRAGEDHAVAHAIREHYRPLGAGDVPARDDISTGVALADRIDTLVGCFAIGLTPTGTADPYALRRACLGLLRILLDRAAESPRYARLCLPSLFEKAYTQVAQQISLDRSQEATVTALLTFATDRLRGLLTSVADDSVLEALFAGEHAVEGRSFPPIAYPVYTYTKAKALQAVVNQKAPWLEKARLVAKRLSGISHAASPMLHPRPHFAGEAMGGIVDRIQELDQATQALVDDASLQNALGVTARLALALDTLFETVLVNNPRDPETPARLELLSYGAHCLRRIGDLSRLAPLSEESA